MPEIRRCPFCGSKAILKKVSGGHSGNGNYYAGYEIGCDKCKIKFAATSTFHLDNGRPEIDYDGYKYCIDKWNGREIDENNDV